MKNFVSLCVSPNKINNTNFMQKKKSNFKKPDRSQRQLQIGEQIKRVLAEIFLQDNLFTIKGGYITILQADISPDAKNAKIFIDVFGKVDGKKIAAELKKISPYLRGKLSSILNLRVTPELMFVLDETSGAMTKIDDLLREEAKKFT